MPSSPYSQAEVTKTQLGALYGAQQAQANTAQQNAVGNYQGDYNNYYQPYTTTVCPTCHYCPTCGRSHGTYPSYPYYYGAMGSLGTVSLNGAAH